MVETKSDIAFVTLVVNQFAKNLSQQHTKVVKTILRYVKATKTIGIVYDDNRKEDLIIRDYFDSDQTKDYATKKSISGFIFILNGGPVSQS